MATILVVDDEPDLVEIVRFRLERDGHSVLTAADGESGLARVLADEPDLIVLDVMMPGWTASRYCAGSRREPAYAAVGAATPVVLLTARADFTAKAQGWEEYADEYVTKPFNVDELARTVQNLLSRSGKIRMA
jgi:two-component system alkaline phosphatase synthesis response regulator PhoP